MEFSVKSGSPEKQRSACIVVGVFEPRRLSPIAEQLDKISDGYISALLRRGELEGKVGQTLLLHHVPNILSERILLIGCGKERELDERQYKQVIQKTINTLNDTGSMEAVCFLTELHVKGRNTYWKVRQAVETAKETLYTFDQLKSNKVEPRRPLRKMVFNVPTRRELTSGERAIQHGLAVASGIKAAKDLGNMPPNICNAGYGLAGPPAGGRLQHQYHHPRHRRTADERAGYERLPGGRRRFAERIIDVGDGI